MPAPATTTRARSTELLVERRVTFASPFVAPQSQLSLPSWSRPSRRLGVAVELVVLVTIVLVALALRADGLMLLPRLTNETGEVRIGLQVARGETLPLVGVKPYTGGLFTLLVAGAFRVLGPSIEIGRLVHLG